MFITTVLDVISNHCQVLNVSKTKDDAVTWLNTHLEDNEELDIENNLTVSGVKSYKRTYGYIYGSSKELIKVYQIIDYKENNKSMIKV